MLKRVLRPLRDAGLGWRAWQATSPARRGVHVNYALPVPASDTPALTGGLVKVGALQETFPNVSRGFNVLYLVSSRLPAGAVQIARLVQRKGGRFVLNQDGVAYAAWHGAGWQATNTALARLVHRADYVFFQSEFSKRSADLFLGPRQRACEVLYNAVDTRVFVPAPSDPARGELVLLLAGSHKHAYRVTTALHTLARLVPAWPSARLVVAGRLGWCSSEATAHAEVERQASDLGIREHVQIRGAYSQATAPALFQACHMLLHTQYNDACPTVVLEAMACGLPVVHSHSGGTPELVGDTAGIGVPARQGWDEEDPPDPDQLAEAIARVHQQRAAFASAARRRAVERFDIRPWLQRHAEVFQELLA
jgi:glycosyltransferase involved in cell wall biosynthesis